jgi:hypothetical protein
MRDRLDRMYRHIPLAARGGDLLEHHGAEGSRIMT